MCDEWCALSHIAYDYTSQIVLLCIIYTHVFVGPAVGVGVEKNRAAEVINLYIHAMTK